MPAASSVMPDIFNHPPPVIPDIFNRESRGFFPVGGHTNEGTEKKTGFPLKPCGNDSGGTCGNDGRGIAGMTGEDHAAPLGHSRRF